MDCEHYQLQSPQNPDFPWCVKYGVNLDRGGRFCGRCVADGNFREMLEDRLRVGSAQSCRGGGGYCEIFGIATDESQCDRCGRDAQYRAFLHGQGVVARKEKIENCRNRGAVLDYEERRCCGGVVKKLEFYACSVRGRVHRGECVGCGEVV